MASKNPPYEVPFPKLSVASNGQPPKEHKVSILGETTSECGLKMPVSAPPAPPLPSSPVLEFNSSSHVSSERQMKHCAKELCFSRILRPLVKEVCVTCGHHNARESTLLMFPGTDTFATIPFHAAHTILEEDQARLDFDSKKLQSFVKEQSLILSEKGALSDKIGPGVLKSLVALCDKPK
ncbi:hypothetical protein SASPL_112261 [Salvia splendens]|uniref:P53 and DNA damage-regulated protein 1 n=1 Tax=Salvia splendens TaxID=180675 RepID=A0A8X8YE40_SALSN|nr:hypothetical protein SASPL_112261 [Salvia splendens]